MVVAMAVATLLVVSVYAVTASMARVAESQKVLAAEEARWLRFEHLLRRDLQSKVYSTRDRSFAPASAGEDVLLEFETTADALTSAMPMRASKVQYVLRQVAGAYEIARIETIPGTQVVELSILKLAERPQVEFWSKNQWRRDPKDASEAKMIRLRTADQSFVLKVQQTH